MNGPAGSPNLVAMSMRAASSNVPLQALVELTGRCHMDCVHCYLDIKNPPRGEMTTAEVLSLLDQLKAAGTMFLTFTGGEIFLRKDIFKLITEAKSRGFVLQLFTSGTLLDRAKIKRIAALKPSAVEISIYSMRSEVHDKVTQRPGSLRKSLRAAVLLRQAGVVVAIKSPLIDGTGDAHFEIIDGARRLGAGYRLDPSMFSRRDGGTEPLSLRATHESRVRLFSDKRLVPADTTLPGMRDPNEAPCAIGRRVVRIDPTGKVFPCSVFPIAAGDLREQDFADIWTNSPVLHELRAVRIKDLQGGCSSCSRQGYCGRCNAQALLEHGNFLGPTSEGCGRAEAMEETHNVPPPPGARHIRDSLPLGRRALSMAARSGPLVQLRRAK